MASELAWGGSDDRSSPPPLGPSLRSELRTRALPLAIFTPLCSSASTDSLASTQKSATVSQRYVHPLTTKTAPFLEKLLEMITEEPHLIQWRDGMIVIPDPKKLEEKLPTYFRHKQYSSFQRQLNNFGYNKQTKGVGRKNTVYIKVKGDQVFDAEGLLALRPSLMRTSPLKRKDPKAERKHKTRVAPYPGSDSDSRESFVEQSEPHGHDSFEVSRDFYEPRATFEAQRRESFETLPRFSTEPAPRFFSTTEQAPLPRFSNEPTYSTEPPEPPYSTTETGPHFSCKHSTKTVPPYSSTETPKRDSDASLEADYALIFETLVSPTANASPGAPAELEVEPSVPLGPGMPSDAELIESASMLLQEDSASGWLLCDEPPTSPPAFPSTPLRVSPQTRHKSVLADCDLASAPWTPPSPTSMQRQATPYSASDPALN